ncbi:MAG TPA: hypothetical protein PKA74_10095, partial [Bauldia sp.]|nr:hypothetical protein [Bauldia sp.]
AAAALPGEGWSGRIAPPNGEVNPIGAVEAFLVAVLEQLRARAALSRHPSAGAGTALARHRSRATMLPMVSAHDIAGKDGSRRPAATAALTALTSETKGDGASAKPSLLGGPSVGVKRISPAGRPGIPANNGEVTAIVPSSPQ